MNCSVPDLPVHHQLPESNQTHVHWVSDAIQPSCPLLSPSPPALNLSRHQGLFFFFFKYKCIYFNWRLITLQYCIGFAINESALCIRWPEYWSFGFKISPTNEYPGLISFRIDWWISLQSNGLSGLFSNTTVQKHQFFGTQLSLLSNSHIHKWLLEKP